jgi:hypothetical protein
MNLIATLQTIGVTGATVQKPNVIDCVIPPHSFLERKY